jgi:WD40 repeat protein
MNINFVKQLAANQIIYAPDVVDNYYSHVLDWSKRGPICVALRSDCYLYNNEIISKLPFSTKYVTGFSLCSVKFNREATLLFMGDTEGMLHVVDIEAEREIRTVNSHLSRISCIENTFEWGLLTGSKDCSIAHSDLRSKNSVFMRLMAHKEEVCGLSVQNNKIASGSRDGSVLVWNLNDQNLFKSHRLHKGAVKALQWCPWRANILASGGGHSDHKILLWNSESEEIEQVLEGKSQITGLAWRESAKDLLTAHRGNQRESYAMIWNSKIK